MPQGNQAWALGQSRMVDFFPRIDPTAAQIRAIAALN